MPRNCYQCGQFTDNERVRDKCLVSTEVINESGEDVFERWVNYPDVENWCEFYEGPMQADDVVGESKELDMKYDVVEKAIDEVVGEAVGEQQRMPSDTEPLVCPNCGSRQLNIDGQFVTEYHDATITFNASAADGVVTLDDKNVEGSYYLDTENSTVTCPNCGWEGSIDDLGEEDDRIPENLVELLQGLVID